MFCAGSSLGSLSFSGIGLLCPWCGAGGECSWGRGAGGVCFIKDVAALTDFYEAKVGNKAGSKLMRAAIDKNIELLVASGKDLDLLAGVHGKKALKNK